MQLTNHQQGAHGLDHDAVVVWVRDDCLSEVPGVPGVSLSVTEL